MSQPQQRASRLRTAALASTVALAAALPLAAATAGTGRPDAGAGGARQSAATSAGSPASASSPAGPRPSAAPAERHGRQYADSAVSGASGDGRLTASCGPELTSPDGVQAQTCVLVEEGDTWARTYHHNTSTERARAVLTLLRPDGRTVRVSCVLEAAARPGVCETPRDGVGAARAGVAEVGEVDRGGRPVYSAVAEIASLDGDRLLLRSGSNSPHLAAS